ncbi:MAG: phage portal protein [Rhodoferax sp.]|nr:phage portal protein [Rhodoferax sp.]MDP3650895.1 phage portal protein [Rhodoferax sp.]
MGFLARAVAEQKSGGVYERWLQLLSQGAKSKAGPSVTLQSAFRVSAAFACMRAISTQGCAQVPFKLMQDYVQDGLPRKRTARDHAIYDLVTAKPNGWQTSFEFKETLTLHASLGNAYAFKNIFRGKLLELILLDPGRVKPVQNEDWSITYKVTGKDGTSKEFSQDLIWHVRGPSWDGFMGLDTLNVAREALGLSIALEESHASLHANGVRPSGVYSVEGSLDTEQQKKLVGWLKQEAAAGVGTPMVLDRGAKWLSQAMTGVDAQHKETRDMQVEEVCRFFGILPVVIGYSGGKANTYASSEVMFDAHKVLGLNPWFERIQDSANINLLTDKERREGYYFKFFANGLLRASAKDRAEYYAKSLGSGGSPAWHTQDEIRAFEDQDPMGGDAAKLPPLINKPSTPPPTP